MRTEFVYSLAALAAFPIAVNANVDALNVGKITVDKGGETAWTMKEAKTMAKGKYSFNASAPTGTADKKVLVKILKDDVTLVSEVFKVGEAIKLDFTLTDAADIKVQVEGQAAAADYVIAESGIELNYDFTNVAELLQIEYNKVTQVLENATYADKDKDAQTYSKLYDRVVAIANADYAFYAADKEGLQSIYDGNQTDVTGLSLYTEIADALTTVKDNQVAQLQGPDQLGALNARYGKLAGDYEISYVTDDLTKLKTAAEAAIDEFAKNPTAETLQAAYDALKAYDGGLKAVENDAAINEKAKADLDESVNTKIVAYYNDALTQIDKFYTNDYKRYDDLKAQVEGELNDYLNGDTYKGILDDIDKAYKAKKAEAEKNGLGTRIFELREQMTRTVSDYNEVREQLEGVYGTYDAEKKAADELTAKAKGFLVPYKNTVDAKVNDLKTFIEDNDQFATVPNLTTEAIAAKCEPITAAKHEYKKQADIYADYEAMTATLENEAKSLEEVGKAVDKDAKDVKKLDEGTYKPTTIWATTIKAINDQITDLEGKVDANATDATKYKDSEEYTDGLAGIKSAIEAFNANALAANELYATYKGQATGATTLLDALNDKNKDPKVDLTALNVWTNQVTIDDAVKARTPYKNFINTTDGSVTLAIAALQQVITDAPTKTAVLNDKGDNVDNILAFLKSKSKESTAVVNGTATMEAIKANYENDEKKFDQQIEQQECEGIATMINSKATVFEPMVADLQKRIDAKEFGLKKGAKLQEEIEAIHAKINAAKAVAAKADATKDELTKAYDSIKDLDTKDIKTAQDHAATYSAEFATFTTRYNSLNGTKDDGAGAPTVYGLKASYNAEKETIKAMKSLTDAQKSALYSQIDNVKFERGEGDKKETFTLASVEKFIEDAWQNEELKQEVVDDYKNNIIPGLKTAANKVTLHAANLNNLEGQVATVQKNINDTKAEVLKKDKNENGFYYQRLIGNAKEGQETYDLNKIKSDFEADAELTDAEVTTFTNKINGVNERVFLEPGFADDNYKAYKAAQDAYDKNDKDHPGALQRYAVARAELDKYTSTQLANQQAVIDEMKDKLDQLYVEAGESYDKGNAKKDDYESQINTQIKDIEDKIAEYTNTVNYNAQIAADNKAMDAAITEAKNAADKAYATSSSIINAYKLFKSTELKTATQLAEGELDALLACLEVYDEKVSTLREKAAIEYAKTVSPTKFDPEGSYVKQFQEIENEIKELTKALSEAIDEVATSVVDERVNKYTSDIKAAKAQVKTFSAGDPLKDNVVDELFTDIDKLLKAINDVKDKDEEIKALDVALVEAEEDGGINDQITDVKRNQAVKALNEIIGATDANLLSEADQKTFNDYKKIVQSAKPDDKQKCVDNFETYKADLKNLQAKAEQQAKDKAAIAATQKAINEANTAVSVLDAKYKNLAVGYQVKDEVEQLASELAKYPANDVNIGNAEAWKKAADDIKAGVTPIYNKLYEAEVELIEGTDDVQGLIAKAREENLTWSGDKEQMATDITAEETKLADVKKAVAENDKDSKKGKTRTQALTDLKGIESMLNGYLNTMTKDNAGDGVNKNAILADNFRDKYQEQWDAWEAAWHILDGYDKSKITDLDGAILDALLKFDAYIDAHEHEMVAYEANAKEMLADIEAANAEYMATAKAEKAAQDKAKEEAAKAKLANTWKESADAIKDAKNSMAKMNTELEAYGSESSYANKVSKLNEQIAAAEQCYNDSVAKAEPLAIDKQQEIATATVAAVDAELFNLGKNCDDIIDMAKQAYIGAFTAELNAQVIPDTWSTSANYTKTDKATLTTERNALVQLVVILEDAAKNKKQAEDLFDKDGKLTDKGVITTLNEGAEQFYKDLETLKADVKDMSLAEDKKGHIANGGANEEITTDDLEALVDIILNDEEYDLDACDVNGDGEVDVTDLVWLRYFLVHNDWPVANAVREMASNANDAINMQVVSVDGNITRLAINLSNETMFRDFQIKMQLPAGAKLVGKSLGERVEGVNLMSSDAANGTVSFVALGTTKGAINGEEGAVLYLDVENLNGVVTIGKAIFVDNSLVGHDLTSTSEATGIRETIANALNSATQKFFDVSGRMMNSLKNGINIIRNNDGTSQKVLKK